MSLFKTVKFLPLNIKSRWQAAAPFPSSFDSVEPAQLCGSSTKGSGGEGNGPYFAGGKRSRAAGDVWETLRKPGREAEASHPADAARSSSSSSSDRVD